MKELSERLNMRRCNISITKTLRLATFSMKNILLGTFYSFLQFCVGPVRTYRVKCTYSVWYLHTLFSFFWFLVFLKLLAILEML
jgi:hypothetical protein